MNAQLASRDGDQKTPIGGKSVSRRARIVSNKGLQRLRRVAKMLSK